MYLKPSQDVTPTTPELLSFRDSRGSGGDTETPRAGPAPVALYRTFTATAGTTRAKGTLEG